MENEIINKVAESGLITLNLEDYYPIGERVLFDLKEALYEGLILKEKEFRNYVEHHDWSKYNNKFVAITCTADAVIPTWAYMLVAVHLHPYAKKIVQGDMGVLETVLFAEELSKINPSQFHDQRVMIKGCSSVAVPESAYVEITRILQPVVKSIMYGEACSTVPLYKNRKSE